MARYQMLRIGVWDSVANQRIIPQSGTLWDAYQAWLKAGNEPDPYVPPTPIAETLAQAKFRKRTEIAQAGVALIQTRFPAINNFQMLYLVRELVLSISPAARALTDDIAWAGNVYLAGQNASDQVGAATTIPQVNAVTPNWPAP